MHIKTYIEKSSVCLRRKLFNLFCWWSVISCKEALLHSEADLHATYVTCVSSAIHITALYYYSNLP